jgi:hypothetical protein
LKKQDKKQFKTWQPIPLIKLVKHRVIEEGCSISDLVGRAIMEYLNKRRGKGNG